MKFVSPNFMNGFPKVPWVTETYVFIMYLYTAKFTKQLTSKSVIFLLCVFMYIPGLKFDVQFPFVRVK
jgi:hypothetical protein